MPKVEGSINADDLIRRLKDGYDGDYCLLGKDDLRYIIDLIKKDNGIVIIHEEEM